MVWTMGLDFLATFFSGATSLLPIFADQVLKVGARARIPAAAPLLGALAGRSSCRCGRSRGGAHLPVGRGGFRRLDDRLAVADLLARRRARGDASPMRSGP
jgi:hypothetical protein